MGIEDLGISTIATEEQPPENQKYSEQTQNSKTTNRFVHSIAPAIVVTAISFGLGGSSHEANANVEPGTQNNKAIPSLVIRTGDHPRQNADNATIPEISQESEEKYTWQNPYEQRVFGEMTQLWNEIRVSHGIQVNSSLPEASEFTFAASPVNNLYQRYSIGKIIQQKLNRFPPELTKNIDNLISVYNGLDLWGSTFIPAGFFDSGRGFTIDLSSFDLVRPQESKVFLHELTHAVIDSLKHTEEFYEVFENLYKNCPPYSYDYDTYVDGDERIVCHPESFATDYGTINPLEDAATIAEALFGKNTAIEIYRRANAGTPDADILKSKIELIKLGYYLASNGKINQQFWDNLSAEIEETQTPKTSIDNIGLALYINPSYIQILFPAFNFEELDGLSDEDRITRFREFVLEDIKSNLPSDIADFIINSHANSNGVMDETRLARLLKILSTDLTRLTPELTERLRKTEQLSEDLNGQYETAFSLEQLLTMDPVFFELTKQRILNQEISDDKSYSFITNINSIAEFFEFYGIYNSIYETSPEDFFELVSEAFDGLPPNRVIPVSNYGYWLVSVSELEENDGKKTLASPLSYRWHSNVLVRGSIDKPEEGFALAINTYKKWRQIFPEKDEQEYLEYLNPKYVHENRGRLLSYSFILNHVINSYPSDEWQEKVIQLSSLQNNINALEMYDQDSEEMVNYVDEIIGREDVIVKGELSYRSAMKDFLEILANNPNTTISARSLHSIAIYSSFLKEKDRELFFEQISNLSSILNDIYMTSPFDDLANLLSSLHPDEKTTPRILEILKQINSSSIPVFYLSTIDTKFKYENTEIEGILVPLYEKLSEEMGDISNFGTYYNALVEVENAGITAEEKESLYESIRYLANFNDSGVYFNNSIDDVYRTIGITNPSKFVEFLQLKKQLTQIFIEKGLDQSNVPDFEDNKWNPSGGLPIDASNILLERIFSLDETATTSDYIIELKIAMILEPQVQEGYISEQDIENLRNSYYALSENGIYPKLVVENTFSKVISSSPDAIRRLPELVNMILSSSESGITSPHAYIGLSSLISPIESPEDPNKTTNFFASRVLNPDSTFEDMYAALERISDSPVQSGESALAHVMMHFLRSQENPTEALQNPHIRQAIILYNYYASGLIDMKNYNSFNNFYTPELILSLLSFELEIPDQGLQIDLSESELLTLDSLLRDGMIDTEATKDIVEAVFPISMEGKDFDIKELLTPQGMHRTSKFNGQSSIEITSMDGKG